MTTADIPTRTAPPPDWLGAQTPGGLERWPGVADLPPSARERPLRIAQLTSPVEPIPPGLYGGTERVVSVLTEELVRRGHEVTLFASGDSRTAARLIAVSETAIWRDPRYEDALPFVAVAIDEVFRRAEEFDVIHNHLGFLAFPAARAAGGPPVVSTLHGRLDLPEWAPLFRYFREMPVVSISDAQRAPLPFANWAATIHHGIDLRNFHFSAAPGSYLAFLGRIAPEKGPDTAIRVAQRAGMPIKIAARLPLNQAHNAEAQRDWRFYREEIEPLLDLPGVEFVGEVDEAGKSEFLGNAAALLFPIRWPEPFGLVMAEALACGTPVLALRQGSAPEVIEDGVTGFVVDDEDTLVDSVARLASIDRARCREVAERRFSPGAMAARYEEVFRRVIAGAAVRGSEERG